MIAGPETEATGDSLLHTILRHLERHDMNLVLVRIHVCLQGDVVPFMSFYRIRVAYGPTLTVLVAQAASFGHSTEIPELMNLRRSVPQSKRMNTPRLFARMMQREAKPIRTIETAPVEV